MDATIGCSATKYTRCGAHYVKLQSVVCRGDLTGHDALITGRVTEESTALRVNYVVLRHRSDLLSLTANQRKAQRLSHIARCNLGAPCTCAQVAHSYAAPCTLYAVVQWYPARLPAGHSLAGCTLLEVARCDMRCCIISDYMLQITG